MQYDNGVFWMDYNSVCKYFSVIHMSWNPELFKYKIIGHEHWKVDSIPRNDKYNLGNNPQYKLTINGKGSIWVMLTRHYTHISDRSEDFVTLHGFKNYGNRAFYREDAYKNGIYSNNPHCLISICMYGM